MAHTVYDTADDCAIKLFQMHDQVTTCLDDTERVLEIRPVFWVQVSWTGFALFLNIYENPPEFFRVVGEICLKQDVKQMTV